jgi:hypothetical protein
MLQCSKVILCHNNVTVAFQWCSSGVAVVFKQFHSGVTELSKLCTMVSQWCYTVVKVVNSGVTVVLQILLPYEARP